MCRFEHTVVPGQKDTKARMREELNMAYGVLLNLTCKLDLKAFNEELRKGRSFLSKMVDDSDYPSC